MLIEVFLFIFAIVKTDEKHHADRREWLWKFALYLNHIGSRERIIIRRCSNGRVCLFRATKMTTVTDNDGGG